MNKENHFLIILLAVILAVSGFSQTNLVPNPSFEEKDWNIFPDKPDGIGQLEKTNDWKNFKF